MHLGCIDRVWGWLKELPRLEAATELAQLPGQGSGERIRSGRPGSRLPAATDPLSLRAASSARMGAASFRRPAGWTPDGTDLPIREWVAGWVDAWRARNGHHRPELADPHTPAPTDRATAPTPPGPAPQRPNLYGPDGLLPPDQIRPILEAYVAELGAWQRAADEYRAAFAQWKPEADAIAAEGARVVLGLGAALDPAERPDDPLDEKLQHRLGQRAMSASLGANCGYLANWFDHAVDHPSDHPDDELEGFVTGLRTLVSRVKAVLGEERPHQIGKCPEPVRDRDTGVDEPCGTRLWTDPQIDDGAATCRRCRTTYPRDRWLWLAARQREVWPGEAPDRDEWEAAS